MSEEKKTPEAAKPKPNYKDKTKSVPVQPKPKTNRLTGE